MIAINLYGEQVGPGYVVDEGGCITLYMDDDTQLVTLYQTAYGELLTQTAVRSRPWSISCSCRRRRTS